MTDNQDKWERLKIANPRLWQRRQECVAGIEEAIERVRAAREEHSEGIPMGERVDMARDLLGDLAGEVDVMEDGAVVVHLKSVH